MADASHVVVLTPEQLRAIVAEEVRTAVREELQRQRDEREVTLAEAAELLRVSERTVRTMAGDGRLPHRRVGREYRFRVGDLESSRE